MKKPALQFPSRLVENTDEIGQLLRESMEDSPQWPSEPKSWHGLVEKRQGPALRIRISLGYGMAVLGACAIALVYWAQLDQHRTRFSAAPEVTSPARAPSAQEPARAAAAAHPVPEAAARSRRASSPRLEDNGRTGGAATGNEVARESAPAATPDKANDTLETSAVCAVMVRKGQLEQAADCYGRIAQGSSMDAEVALYEKARLESRALGRGGAALATLDEHARRFPAGVLSTEAGLTRIELLTRLGRNDEALRAIETALAGPIGKERGGDLYALRGQILSNRGDCVGANAAFALARSHGVPQSRPLAGEKRCAEQPEANVSTTNTNP